MNTTNLVILLKQVINDKKRKIKEFTSHIDPKLSQKMDLLDKLRADYNEFVRIDFNEINSLLNLFNLSDKDKEKITKELDTISRRESDTGFYFGRDNIKPTLKGYLKGRRLMGMIADDSEEYAKITVYNTIKNGDNLVYIGKDFIKHNDNRFKLFIKTEENEFIEVDNIRNIDNAYIKSGAHDFKKYDIITIED